MNDISTTLFYNQRIILSAPIKEPIAWKCSKVEQTNPKGIFHLTFKQDAWDTHKDVFEYSDGTITNVFNPEKSVVAMWADYYDSKITPEYPEIEPQIPKIYSIITHNGTKPELKSGGNYKTLTVRFYKDDDTEINPLTGVWSYLIDNIDVSDLILTKPATESNQISVKFKKNDMYIGKVMTVKYTSDTGIESSLDLEILGL